MIILYSGTPGSGKSLHVADMILKRDRIGLYTICNFEVNNDLLIHPDRFFYIDNLNLSPDLLFSFSIDYFKEHKFREGSILLILDEAQLLFNVREWNKSGRSDWIHFFTQHRKVGYDVILIAQFDKMIDKQVRSLFEYEYIHRKVSNFGWKGKLLSIWSGNRLFICVKMWYPMRTKVGSERFHYKKKLGLLYDTLGLFNKPDGNSAVKFKDDDSKKGDDGIEFFPI